MVRSATLKPVPERDEAAATLAAESEADASSGPAVSTRPVLGDVFASRYRIEALLGRGGMGSVYRARDTLVDELVALKVLDGAAPGTAAVERFRREVRLARRITSPHVARTHDLGTHDGVHYLTMDLVDGPSLASIIASGGALSPQRAAHAARAISEGLGAAHAAGVIHRDLKPDNVLVESAGRVVVTDFGIARALHDDPAAAFRTGGGVVGTPLYMAPEQVAGAPLDARSDIYSLGLVLYEMLTGEVAFFDASPIAAAVKRLSQPAPDPRARVSVPDALAQIALRCMSRAPEDRFADAAALAFALDAFLAGGTAVEAAALARTPAHVSTPSMPGGRSPIAPLSLGARALAVLPFAYRGAASDAWVGDGIGDELIDVLSRTRGLRVLGRGATARFRDDRDPRAAGRDLGVDFIVDGTVQSAGERLRVVVRLLEVATGTQLWSERFDTDVEDLFEVQERVARRIAEALRVGMHGVGFAGAAPPEAIELYHRARQTTRTPGFADGHLAVEQLDRVIALAPQFAPAYPHRAMAIIRAWFRANDPAGDGEWQASAQAAVDQSLALAPDLPETHLAVARFAAQMGRYRDAVSALRHALSLAPTLAEAHQTLGALQIEAGRAKEGIARLDLALSLEPTLLFARFEKARWHGLYGELAVADRELEIIRGWPGTEGFAGQLILRIGAYRRDTARVRDGLELLERTSHPAARSLRRFAAAFLGEEVSQSELSAVSGLVDRPGVSPRFASLVHQLTAEAAGHLGAHEAALAHAKSAADLALVDLEWLERCPLLAGARALPEIDGPRAIVRARCEEIWRA